MNVVCALFVALALVPGAQAQNSTAPASGFRLPPDGRAPGVQGPANDGIPPLTEDDRREEAAPPPPAPREPTTERESQAAPPRAAAPRPVSSGQAPPRRAAPAPTNTAAPAPSPTPDTAAPAVDESALGDSAADTGTDTGTPLPPVSAEVVSKEPAFTLSGARLWALIAAAALVVAGLLYLALRTLGRRRQAAPAHAAATAAEPELLLDIAAAEAMAIPPKTAPKPGNVTVTRAAPPAFPRPRVEMALQLEKMEVTADALVVGFRLHLTNKGDAPAEGALVRVALMQARSGQESAIAKFFDGTGGRVLADGADIAPGATVHVDAEAQLPLAAVTALTLGGRNVLIPVLALDTSYHWAGMGDGFGQVAGAYVLGQEPAKANGETARLGPIPLTGPRFVSRPGARATGLQVSQ